MKKLITIILTAVSVSTGAQTLDVGGIYYQKTIQKATTVTYPVHGVAFYDFQEDAFGRVLLHIKKPKDGDTVYVYTGECVKDGRVDRTPGGSKRCCEMMVVTKAGQKDYDVPVPRNKRNTGVDAIKMPEEIGEVTPFRYVEVISPISPKDFGTFSIKGSDPLIEKSSEKSSGMEVRRMVVNVPFDDEASYFHCDNDTLNQVWELCKHTIKATSFTGYYVDGDRERIPYEADALINQLGHYGTDAYYDTARRTFAHLMNHPTWPSEWILQMPMIAWNDYLYTGNTELIKKYQKDLCAHTLMGLGIDVMNTPEHSDTLLITTRRGQSAEFLKSINRKAKISDIVDWPHSKGFNGAPGEDDHYVYTDYNTVVNAYHYEAVKRYADMMMAIGNTEEGIRLKDYLSKFYINFNELLLDKEKGCYRDGVGTDHCSLHANMFAVAFGLVPEEYKKSVGEYLVSRGMACSVYGAQFLLDALYDCGQADYALKLMTSNSRRSWVNMMREGSTMTMEAWGDEFKSNQDWNHAWGAVPANVIPMRLVGVRPLKPGFEEVEIRPQIGFLKEVESKVPTPKGPIFVSIQREADSLSIDVKAPDGMKVHVVRPYQDYRLSPEQRAEDLCSRLTLEEKAKLMIDQSESIPRLGIPEFQWWNETLHGVARNGYATVFPITMGMAASFDDDLVYQCFSAASDEARIKYNQASRSGNIMRYQGLSFWTPNINIFRDPRWGRGQETYGEDPYLTERMGLAVVRGLQGQPLSPTIQQSSHSPQSPRYRGAETPEERKGVKYYKLLACAKHFAVHSGPEWNRHSFNIENLPERDLWETYLPAFKSLVQEGNVAEVMCAYQSIDGQPCCGQTRYLQQILRGEWGFKGIVVSDCGAIRDFHTKGCHEYTKTPEESVEKAVLAGTDNNCGKVYKSIPEAVKQGLLKESDIDVSLKRLLVGRFKLGEMDPDDMVPWNHLPDSLLCSAEHSNLAYKMARESIVLLKNKKNLLPLSRGLRIAVIGPNANDSVMQWGNYSGYPRKTVTILEGIKKKLSTLHSPQALHSPLTTHHYINGAGYVDNSVAVSHFGEMFAPDGTQGMEATYWNNIKMDGTPVNTVRLTAPIRLNNGGATVFAPGVELENFSARYKGIFKPKSSGKVKVSVEADDGLRLIICGDTVDNRFKTGHGIQRRNREITVEAGKEYPIQVDYLQTAGMAHFQFDITHQETLTMESLLSQVNDADVVVFVGGIAPSLEGEEMKVSAKGFKGGDRTDIELPESQRMLLKAIHDAGKKLVYINCSGSAIGLVPEQEKTCDAILQAWYPGEKGGDAVADVLFGDYNPSGKLPITFYRSVNDLPDFLDYTMTGTSADGKSHGRTYRYFSGTPLYPFGYGLSYTTFQKSNITKKREVIEGKDGFTISLDIKNTGKREGSETVFVYVTNPTDSNGPIKTLRAFRKVSLRAGEKQHVTLRIDGEQLLWWDKDSNTMHQKPDQLDVIVE